MSDFVSRVLAAVEAKQRKAQRAIDGIIRWDATPEMADFIADNDPAAVLRHCQVDRELAEWCEGWQKTFRGPIPEGHTEEAALHFRMAAEYVLTRLEARYGISVEEETTGE